MYELFIRARVGGNTYNDDSMFIGKGFGAKNPALSDDWIRINGLAAGGFSEAAEAVRGPGILGSGEWKWMNLSRNLYQSDDTVRNFTVLPGALTVTFEIGGRENGLDIDKIAFGRTDLIFTVDNLDRVQAGAPEAVQASAPARPGVVYEPMARGKPKFLGNVYSVSQEPRFTEFWNQVTPENAGKWGSAEPARDSMNWAELDAAYKLAKDKGFPFRFHVLVWGNQQPAWMDTLAPAEQLEEIREWFEQVARRYPDIAYLEVVNEPLHDPPDSPGEGNYYEALGGAGKTGWDWVVNAFRYARTSFPKAALMLNEYGVEDNRANTERYLELVRLLQSRDLIDCIGIQAHAFNTGADASVIKANLDLLATAGLPIQVTEMDIDGADDAVQLAEYKRVFPVFWDHPAVIGITMWGWRIGMWRTTQKAFLIQDTEAERPALKWLREYVERR